MADHVDLLSIGFLCLLAFQVTSAQNGKCANVGCSEGKMCIEESGGQTTCVCPQVCLNEEDTVCSVYLLSFYNLCELHKFACRYEIPIAVSSKGSCDVNALRSSSGKNVSVCSTKSLLQFGDRYLEWILVTKKRQEEDRYYRIKSNERGYLLAAALRAELAQWAFQRADGDKDGVLLGQEIDNLIDPFLFNEHCMYGFVLSCDQDKKPGITRNEWLSCFPSADMIRE